MDPCFLDIHLILSKFVFFEKVLKFRTAYAIIFLNKGLVGTKVRWGQQYGFYPGFILIDETYLFLWQVGRVFFITCLTNTVRIGRTIIWLILQLQKKHSQALSKN